MKADLVCMSCSSNPCVCGETKKHCANHKSWGRWCHDCMVANWSECIKPSCQCLTGNRSGLCDRCRRSEGDGRVLERAAIVAFIRGRSDVMTVDECAIADAVEKGKHLE